jgi:hypothetical protein
MSNTVIKEEVVKNSNPPQNGNKGNISDYNTLMMYWNNRELLQMNKVKETIEFLVNLNKNNGSGTHIIKLGERLLLEYDKPNWIDGVELQFLKEDLEELENQKSYWKSRIVEGRRSFWDKGISKYKGVVPYDTMDEYYEDISYIKKNIEKLEKQLKIKRYE